MNQLIKLLSSYIFVVIIVFLMTIPFIKNSNKPYFINLNPKNIFIELEEEIDDYVAGKKNLEVIKSRGTIVIPLILDKMKNNSAKKNEYINLYNDLEFELFEIPENEEYNLKFYISELDKVIINYNNEKLDKELENYLIDKNISKIKKTGTIILPNLMDFLKKNENRVEFNRLKPLYLLLNKKVSKNRYTDENLKAWFNSFVAEKRDYLKRLSLIQRAKMLITETMFFDWIVKSFTFNFGIDKNISIYDTLKKYTLKTLLVFIFSIFIGYNFILLFILNKKLKMSNFLNKNVKFINIFPTIIVIILLSLINRYLLSKNNHYFIYFYIFSVFLVVVSMLKVEIDVIYKNILENRKILMLKLYGLSNRLILKKYILKKMNIESIDKIINITPLILFYIIIIEYIFNFHGVGYLFVTSLKSGNYQMLRGSILALGIILIFTKTVLLLIINLRYGLIKK